MVIVLLKIYILAWGSLAIYRNVNKVTIASLPKHSSFLIIYDTGEMLPNIGFRCLDSLCSMTEARLKNGSWHQNAVSPAISGMSSVAIAHL